MEADWTDHAETVYEAYMRNKALKQAVMETNIDEFLTKLEETKAKIEPPRIANDNYGAF